MEEANGQIIVIDGMQKVAAVPMKLATFDFREVIESLGHSSLYIDDFVFKGKSFLCQDFTDAELTRLWESTTYSSRLRVIDRLEGVTDPLEIQRIIREWKALREPKFVVKRKDQGLGAALIQFLFTQSFVKGLVKILFAPLKINLDSLRPIRTAA